MARLRDLEAIVSTGKYRYKVYGLSLCSDFPLPELREAKAFDAADVEICRGSVPVQSGSGEGLSIGPRGALLRIDEVASYLVRDGREIVVDRAEGGADGNMRLYLLGSALGILLHQRGLLPLHANAVEVDGKAVAFMGESGAGKSTLAASLHDAGYRLVSDDVCVVHPEENGERVRVQPGLPRIRLWKDALERTGREIEDHERSWSGDESYEKFDVPVSPDQSVAGALDLAAIYLLSSGERFDVSPITGMEAVDAVFSHTYRGFVVPELGRSQLHFNAAVMLARSTPIFSLERRRDPADMAADVSRVVEHARKLING